MEGLRVVISPKTPIVTIDGGQREPLPFGVATESRRFGQPLPSGGVPDELPTLDDWGVAAGGQRVQNPTNLAGLT
jgi:hypothetical protein